MQLVRVIEVGIDADGDGVPDLNPSRIFYFGLSLGTNYGAPFLAVEPTVRAGDLTSIVGPFIENRITILLMAPLKPKPHLSRNPSPKKA